MIELKNVSYAYPSAEGAASESLCGADFTLAPGELVALVGANGAGKSTLGRVLCGTFVPSAGEVLNNGTPASSSELHHLVGYVRQDPTSQLVSPTVFDEVAFGPCNLGLPEAEMRKRIAWALDAASLGCYEERLVSDLSGGELQRLALAGVLAMKPSYIVLDEVSSMLDYASRTQLRAIVAEQVAAGVGVLSIAHDAIEVALASRVVLLEAGRVAWEGTPSEFFASSDLVERACMHVPSEGSVPSKVAHVHSDKPAAPVLELEHVEVTYESNHALKDVSLTPKPGELLLIAGRSGSGKSTLAAVCAGLLKPENGTAYLKGAPIEVGTVGYCMQRPEAQLFCDTVLDDVAFALVNRGVAAEDAKASASKLLERFGVAKELWDKSPFLLSGGQRRRVALAGIVALDTEAFIFDEPTVGLDAAGCAQLKEVLVGLARAGKTVMVVSHDVDLWLNVVKSVALLSAGELIWQGSPSELYVQDELLLQAGLGKSVTQQFKEALAAQSAAAGTAQGGERHE